jgi:hypothetical protein
MEYARNMTIIENAYKKITEEKAIKNYKRKVKEPRAKNIGLLKRFSSANLAVEVSDLKNECEDISHLDRKSSTTIVINPDKLETSLQLSNEKNKMARSASVQINYEQDGAFARQHSLHSLNDEDRLNGLMPLDSLQRVGSSISNLDAQQNTKTTVIHRKFIYFDKQGKDTPESR